MQSHEKKALRNALFRHLDGIVIAPIAHLIKSQGLFDYILEQKSTSLSALSKAFKANEGYLNVALRAMASQGWLDYHIESAEDIQIQANHSTAFVNDLLPLYADVVKLMHISTDFHPRKFEREPFLFLEQIFKKFEKQYGIHFSENLLESQIQKQVLSHIEGHIVGPTVVALGMSGMFHKYFMEASFRADEFHGDAESFGRLLDMFVFLEWFEKKNETYRFTEKGLFYARRASAYGVTVSYIPMFRKLKDLIFGDPNIIWDLPKGAKEIHVDRKMNVWGSGGAHSAYFRKIDEIIIDLFNQPISMQPKGIVDMGCGNGAFLIHLFDIIEKRTLRGTMLDEHPLFLVGADYNAEALKVSRKNLIQAGIWAKLIWGDIGRPDILAQDLQENYQIDLGDLLNVRTFLDHNRIWADPIHPTENRISQSTGAYAFRGRRIRNHEVEDNLKEHLEKWAPYLEQFGLLVIELHTIPPNKTRENLGKTAATAYDATHGFSDQFIVELDVFHKIASEAGLYPDEKYFRRFPDSELATVSLNLFKRKERN